MVPCRPCGPGKGPLKSMLPPSGAELRPLKGHLAAMLHRVAVIFSAYVFQKTFPPPKWRLSWAHVGPILGSIQAILAPCQPILRLCWRYVGPKVGLFQATFTPCLHRHCLFWSLFFREVALEALSPVASKVASPFVRHFFSETLLLPAVGIARAPPNTHQWTAERSAVNGAAGFWRYDRSIATIFGVMSAYLRPMLATSWRQLRPLQGHLAAIECNLELPGVL